MSMLTKDESHRDYWSQAWRFIPGEVGSGRHEPCDWDDPEARIFEIKYPGMHQSGQIRFEDRRLAEHVLRACLTSFEQGGERKLTEFKRFLGL